jgi:hypothetical protein
MMFFICLFPVQRLKAISRFFNPYHRTKSAKSTTKKKNMEDARRRATANKRLHVNQRVSGAVGEYIEGPTKRRRRQRLFGHIICAVGERRYMVRFDDGSEKECASALLRVENMHASLPPDVNVLIDEPHRRSAEQQNISEEAEEAVIDHEEEEALPPPPEHEEMEAEADNNEQPNEEIDEPPNGMPGQLPTEREQPLASDYATIKQQALEKVRSLVGEKVIVKQRNLVMTWTVISCNDPPDVIPEQEYAMYGLKGFKCEDYKKSEVLAMMFLKLMFKTWKQKVEKLNAAVAASKIKCKPFTESEFLTGLGILIGAAEFAKRGSELFSVKDQVEEEEEIWTSLCADPHFEMFMPFGRWKEFRRFFPEIFANYEIKETDPWFMFSSAIDEFNELRKNLLFDSRWISADETMCAWRPRKTALGGLPNISFIIRKPEPLGKL